MEWIKTRIITESAGIDNVTAVLYDLGITGIEISDSEDFKEFLENNRRYWDYVDEELERLKTANTVITVYLPSDSEGSDTLEKIKAALSELKKSDTNHICGALEVQTAIMSDEDWSENWKKYFKPIEIGKKVLVVPEWENENLPETNRTKFIINPGMSFGTGSHESTKMCIEEMEKYVSDGCTVLDLGCGSGILSVIALLLGAKEAHAVDIDPMAVETAYKNLELNGISDTRYFGYSGDITTDISLYKKLTANKYDIVFANIVADVIISLSGFVKDFMHENSVFICSGIIIDRKDEVINKLQSVGLNVVCVREMGEWAAAVCTL